MSETQTWWATELYPSKDDENFGIVGDYEVMRIEDVQALRDERDRLRANLINCSERLVAYYGDNYPAVVDARAALTPAAGRTRP